MSDKNYLVVRERCPVCAQGRLLIALASHPHDLFVVCEDCESEWDDPESACAALHPTRDEYRFVRYAMLEDVEAHPWLIHVLNHQ